MIILVVDDSKDSNLLIRTFLKKGGYVELVSVYSAKEAFEYLGLDSATETHDVDLILMDIIMPGMDGIEACYHIKAVERLRDVPIIMVTATHDDESLRKAFESGAMDYITKPINKVELLARVGAVLRLKLEMDRRMEVTIQLEAANKKLKLLSTLDGLTGVSNRRGFDETLNNEFRRAIRDKKPISLVMADIDFFKKFNDGYGHQAGDDCLKKVATAIADEMRRPADYVARYGGEEFVCILGETDQEAAFIIADRARAKIESMAVPHEFSETKKVVTISMGLSTVVPEPGITPEQLIKAADEALYKAKREGRNRLKVSNLTRK